MDDAHRTFVISELDTTSLNCTYALTNNIEKNDEWLLWLAIPLQMIGWHSARVCKVWF